MSDGLAPIRHDSLPDTPEPSENPALFGHVTIANGLAADYRAGRLHHGLLLSGPAGIGKATLAFHLAKHLLQHPDPLTAPTALTLLDPASSLARQVASDAHPSVLHLTRPVNERTKGFKSAVTADEVRRINRFLSHTAHDGGWRIVIIDPADDMNRNAANALLKNLEEPPTRTLFILIAHQAGGLLPTIRSRCRLVRLQPLAADDLRKAVGAVRPDLPPLPDAVIDSSGGSVREALLDLAFGGQDISHATQTLLEGRRLDVVRLQTLAETVAGRNAGIRYDLFTARLLDRLAAMAGAAADAGDAARADRLAALWQETSRATGEADAYNLDRKQHVSGQLTLIHAALHG